MEIRPHIALYIGTGILTCFPSATHLCLALGADLLYADERCGVEHQFHLMTAR